MEQPPEQPAPQTPKYDALRRLSPTEADVAINGDQAARKDPMSDADFTALMMELLVIGRPSVRPDIVRAVERRMVHANTTKDTRDLGRRLGVRVPQDPAVPGQPPVAQPMPAADPLAGARERLTPNANAQDKIAEQRDMLIFSSVANGMMTLYRKEAGERGIDTESQSHREAVQTVMFRLKGEPISVLRAIKSPQDAEAVRLGTKHGLSQDQLKALTFVAFFVDARHGDINRMLQKRTPPQNVDNKTLQDFLNEARHLTSFVGEFRESIQADMKGLTGPQKRKQLGASLKKATKIDLGKHMEGQSAFKDQLIQLGLKPENEKAFMEYYGFASKQTVSSARTYTPDSWRNTKEEALVPEFRMLIGKMNEYIQGNAVNYLKLFTHGAAMYDGTKYEDVLAQALAGDMSVQDVVELYIGLQQAEQTLYTVDPADPEKRLRPRQLPTDLNGVTATGGLMLQMKVLNLIGDKNPDAGIAFRGFLAGEGAAMVTNTSKINLPEDLKLPFQQTVAVMAEQLGGNLIDAYFENIWELSLLITGSNWFPDLPGPYEPHIVAGIIHAHVFGGIPATLARMYLAKTAYLNGKRAEGRAMGDRLRALRNPGVMNRLGRLYIPGWANVAIIRTRNQLNLEDGFRRALGRNPALAGKPLSNDHLDALHKARQLADANKSLDEIKNALREVTTEAGTKVPAFTEEEAKAVMQIDDVVGKATADQARAAYGSARAPSGTAPQRTTVDLAVDPADARAAARARLNSPAFDVDAASPQIVLRMAADLEIRLDPNVDAVVDARAKLKALKARR